MIICLLCCTFHPQILLNTNIWCTSSTDFISGFLKMSCLPSWRLHQFWWVREVLSGSVVYLVGVLMEPVQVWPAVRPLGEKVQAVLEVLVLPCLIKTSVFVNVLTDAAGDSGADVASVNRHCHGYVNFLRSLYLPSLSFLFIWTIKSTVLLACYLDSVGRGGF